MNPLVPRRLLAVVLVGGMALNVITPERALPVLSSTFVVKFGVAPPAGTVGSSVRYPAMLLTELRPISVTSPELIDAFENVVPFERVHPTCPRMNVVGLCRTKT